MGTTKLNLYGAGGHGRVIVDIIRRLGWEIGVIYDDDEGLTSLDSIPVVPAKYLDVSQALLLAIGDNYTRHTICERLQHEDLLYPVLIDPSAIVSGKALIDRGTVVMQGAVIQAGTKIGEHCIVNTGAVVDHDVKISDFVHVAPNATVCGGVEIGEETLIGAGTCVIPGVKIGARCIVGAGSVVVDNIPENVMAFGNPCRIFKKM